MTEEEEYYTHAVDFKATLEELNMYDKGEGLIDQGKLTSGGMGTIYTVYEKTLKRLLAMKLLPQSERDNEQHLLQFIEEARITAQLEHPNIIPIHGLGLTDDDELFFTMKLVNGKALSERLKKNSSDEEDLDYFSLLLIFRKVCDAVSYAHSKNIVHRDIKPENIMIGNYGEVLLMDWGIAKYLGLEEESHQDVYSNRADGSMTDTLYGIIKGSPAYMSPEQARAEENTYDKRSDIFLMGATLYHLMTGRPPYAHRNIDQMVIHAENCDFPHPQELAPEAQIPDELCDIIFKAMAKEKEDRYSSIEEMTEVLDALIAGKVSSSRKTFKKGEYIVHYGETGNEAFVIVEGAVEIFRIINGQKNTFTNLRSGDMFGELAAITSELRSADVVATEDTTCLIINSDLLNQQMRKLPPWFAKILTALIKRQRNMDKVVHPLMIGDCTYEVANQLRMMFMCYSAVTTEGVLFMPLQETTKEICCSLKIPEDKVRAVIASLAEESILILTPKLDLIVPSWDLFSDFVDYCKNIPSQGTTTTTRVSKIDVHKIYTDGRSVMLRHSRLNLNEEMGKLGKLRPLSQKLTEDKRISIRKDFSGTLKRVKDYSRKSSSVNSIYFNDKKNNSTMTSKAPKISQVFQKPPSDSND